MIKKLNNYLADLVVFYHKLQNFHWYVKGSSFFTVHAKLEELYDEISENIDEVGEKILMLNAKPDGNLKTFLQNSNIQEAANEFLSSDEIIKQLLKDYEYLLNSTKAIKESADEENNYLISAFIDTQIEKFSKTIWMLKQSL